MVELIIEFNHFLGAVIVADEEVHFVDRFLDFIVVVYIFFDVFNMGVINKKGAYELFLFIVKRTFLKVSTDLLNHLGILKQ